MGEWEKLTADEYQQILDDRRNWNIVQNNNGNNRKHATPMKSEMNSHIKQLQENLDYNKKRLESLSYGNEYDKNPMEPSDSIKGGSI